ncbi:MAG: hypothetical protein BGO98_08345 [Myxococcales bacterium 68-20]|nr:PQQ-binding-like beta-propeller repeat protein [Myxococcales bacterium]OJY25009.1 MAG: hypothetical protein BGO98_08345 [Myxococcales bacterium 68-20]
MTDKPVPSLCARCGAPLPPSGTTGIICPFCGVVNHGPVGRGDLRDAVRDVLAEDRNRNGIPDYLERPPPPVAPFAGAPPRPMPPATLPNVVVVGVVGAVFALVAIGAIAMLTVRRAASRPPTATRQVPSVTASPVQPPAPSTPPPKTWGRLGALTFDESGDVVATIGSSIVKADGTTLAPRWTAPFGFVAAGGGGFYQMLIPRGERIAFVTDSEIQFFDSAAGARKGVYLYNTGGILKGACGVGKTQVIVSVLGPGTMRFDAATGKKATGPGSCTLRGTDLECGPGQWCGWRRAKGNELDCRYELRAGKDVFRACEADDGTKRKMVVALGASGKPKWQTEADVDGFMGVVDGVLIVREGEKIRALDPATGAERWSRTLGEKSAVLVDAKRVFYGIDGTIAVAEAATGTELARMVEAKR